MPKRTARKAAPARKPAQARATAKASKAPALSKKRKPFREPRSPLSAKEFEKELLEALTSFGTPPEIIFAFSETGILQPEHVIGRSPHLRQVLDRWHAIIDRTLGLIAIDDMLAGPADDDAPAHPGYWQSELPEFAARPITKKDHRQVLECLRSIGEVQKRSMSVMARSELAAALLASACSTAYGSAEAQGVAEKGPERYGLTEDFILRRARELYAQGRV
jgi:hypothetical protein